MQPHEHIILPLDVRSVDQAVSLVEMLKNDVGVFKLGLELIHSGPAHAETLGRLKAAGAHRIFLDAKLHDIPNTVAGAMRGIVRMGAWCVTLHASGGSAMLEAAVQMARCEAESQGVARPLLLGVTVLTSIGARELKDEMSIAESMANYAVHLAELAYRTGCDGVVASPNETQAIRAALPSRDFLIVTPGIRPSGMERDDQARINTPGDAIASGADYLVIGRPITAAPDPRDAARRIAEEIGEAIGKGS